MVDATLVNMVETIGILIGVSIAVYELRNIGKTRKKEILLKYAELTTGEMTRKYTDMALSQQYDTYEEWQEKYGPQVNPEAYSNLIAVLNMGNTFGVILKEGLIEPEILYQFWHPNANLIMWQRAEPLIKAWREMYNYTSWAPLEYLVEDSKRRFPEIIIE